MEFQKQKKKSVTSLGMCFPCTHINSQSVSLSFLVTFEHSNWHTLWYCPGSSAAGTSRPWPVLSWEEVLIQGGVSERVEPPEVPLWNFLQISADLLEPLWKSQIQKNFWQKYMTINHWAIIQRTDSDTKWNVHYSFIKTRNMSGIITQARIFTRWWSVSWLHEDILAACFNHVYIFTHLLESHL